MRGLSPGESRRTNIDPERAYGPYSDELVFSIQNSELPTGLELKKGMRVPLSNGMQASVVDITDTGYRLDANHELAGKTLTFDMELVSFIEAVLAPPSEGQQRAVFGLGCFWGMFLLCLSSYLVFTSSTRPFVIAITPLTTHMFPSSFLLPQLRECLDT